MIGNYLRVSKDELEKYLNDSNELENRIYDDENHNDKSLIGVDKSWEALFFLLTGKSIANAAEASPPLAWVLTPLQEIDPDQDLGYGPATYATIEETKKISTAMNEISTEDFKKRYDGKRMMELGIYPEAWDEDESLDYLVENFISLKDFYYNAATNNQAAIVFIN